MKDSGRASEGSRHTNLRGVVGCAENQFRCSVVARADVRDVGLVLDKDLGATEVTQLQNARCRVEQQVLGLDVAMANALRVDVGEGTEQLVSVQLDFQNGHGRLHLVEEARRAIDCLGDVFLDQVQIDLVLLLMENTFCQLIYASGSGTNQANTAG